MTRNRAQFSAILGASLIGTLILTGCTGGTDTPSVSAPTVDATTPTPSEAQFDSRIPSTVTDALRASGWNPGQNLDLPEAIPAEAGTHFSELCPIGPAETDAWLAATNQNSLHQDGTFLYSYIMEFDHTGSEQAASPYGFGEAELIVDSNCTERLFDGSINGQSVNWPNETNKPASSVDPRYDWSSDKFIYSNLYHDAGEWDIFSFDPTSETSKLLYSNKDLNDALDFYFFADNNNYLYFSDQMGIITLVPYEYLDGAPLEDKSNDVELVWFDATGQEKPVQLGYGSIVTAFADGIYVVENDKESSNQVLKYLADSNQAPTLSDTPALFTLANESGFELASLAATDNRVIATLRSTDSGEQVGLLSFNLSDKTVDCLFPASTHSSSNLQAGADFVSWHVSDDSMLYTLRYQLSTQTLLEFSGRVEFNGEYALTGRALLKVN